MRFAVFALMIVGWTCLVGCDPYGEFVVVAKVVAVDNVTPVDGAGVCFAVDYSRPSIELHQKENADASGEVTIREFTILRPTFAQSFGFPSMVVQIDHDGLTERFDFEYPEAGTSLRGTHFGVTLLDVLERPLSAEDLESGAVTTTPCEQ